PAAPRHDSIQTPESWHVLQELNRTLKPVEKSSLPIFVPENPNEVGVTALSVVLPYGDEAPSALNARLLLRSHLRKHRSTLEDLKLHLIMTGRLEDELLQIGRERWFREQLGET